jgi:hypothetical protein
VLFLKKKLCLLIILIVLAMTLTACLPGDGTYTADSPAGFLSGIWHGWLAPVSLILGIVKGGYRVYEVNNIGWTYDLAFYIAIVGGFGGFSLFRKSRKKN